MRRTKWSRSKARCILLATTLIVVLTSCSIKCDGYIAVSDSFWRRAFYIDIPNDMELDRGHAFDIEEKKDRFDVTIHLVKEGK